MGKNGCVAGITLVCLIVIHGCGGGVRSGLTLAGSTSVQPFAEKWAEAYRIRRPDLEIHVQGGGSTAGVQAADSGAAQIGMCSRELKPDEAAKLKTLVVARDGISLIVHPQNPVGDLTIEQIQKIYEGTVTTWKDVGGIGAKITTITREAGSGTRGAFEELVMMHGKKKIAPSALVQDSTGAVRQMVSQDPTAIGYISLGLVDRSVKPLKLAGVEGSEASIDAGKYPLVRPFLFLVKGEPSPMAREFIDFVTGPEGQALTRKEGLFPGRK